MVQYQDLEGKEYDWNRFNEYWRLNNNQAIDRATLRICLDDIHHKSPSKATKAELIHLVCRADRGLIAYTNCTVQELKTFCIQRGLTLPDSPRPGKRQYQKTLEDADEEATFPHFLALPTELRVQIYTHYYNWLGEIDQPVQPPISKICRIVRNESLPLFYATCTFVLDTFDPNLERSPKNAKVQHTNGIFFSSIEEKHLKTIRHLSLECAEMKHVYIRTLHRRYGSIRVESRDGRVLFENEDLHDDLVAAIRAYLDIMQARSQGPGLTRTDITELTSIARRNVRWNAWHKRWEVAYSHGRRQ